MGFQAFARAHRLLSPARGLPRVGRRGRGFLPLGAWDRASPRVVCCEVDAPTDEAWIGTYRRTVRPLYAFVAVRAGGDRALAEDVVQEAWLRAVEAWRAGGPPEDALAWLQTTARNLLWNAFRRLRPESVEGRELDLVADPPRARTQRAAALLAWGLASLSAEQSDLLQRHHLDGQDLAALARERGLSARAVEGRLRRARQALARRLRPYVDPEDPR